MINTTFATICAVVLLGLIVYTQGRKMWVKRKGRAAVCAACGRTIVDRPVKMEKGGRELVFCCEHCADACVKNKSGEKEQQQ
jgi:hypothetical protein